MLSDKSTLVAVNKLDDTFNTKEGPHQEVKDVPTKERKKDIPAKEQKKDITAKEQKKKNKKEYTQLQKCMFNSKFLSDHLAESVSRPNFAKILAESFFTEEVRISLNVNGQKVKINEA